jgi:hypothetical protein
MPCGDVFEMFSAAGTKVAFHGGKTARIANSVRSKGVTPE